MLILSRREHEEIICIIPEEFGYPEKQIRIMVTSIKNGEVKVGIEAPRNVTILRRELYDRGFIYKPKRDDGVWPKLMDEEKLIDRALGEEQ